MSSDPRDIFQGTGHQLADDICGVEDIGGEEQAGVFPNLWDMSSEMPSCTHSAD